MGSDLRLIQRDGFTRRTKIVATIGPASRDEAILRRVIQAGMDVARVNFSHATHEGAAEIAERVRRIAEEEHCCVSLLADLQGPRLRIGPIAGGVTIVEPGSTLVLTTRAVPGSANEVTVEYPRLPEEVRVGDRILINDGRIQLEVLSVAPTDIGARVLTGGELKSHKGINLPNISISAPSLTEKDRSDLAFSIEHGFDFVALSFVRDAADIAEIKSLIAESGSTMPVIAKIEKHEAISHLDEILEAADGVMVARGDLGVEIPAEQVPIVQKQIIARARALAKPVITATQMLESMIYEPRPTRAEASDVANAIFDGTDAVMLSGETASGRYPVEAVETMSRVALTAEAAQAIDHPVVSNHLAPTTIASAITKAAVEIAAVLRSRAILSLTESGLTARLVAKHRPRTPILGITPNPRVLRQLTLVWGVQPLLGRPHDSSDEAIKHGLDLALENGFIAPGDRVVITSGAPPHVAGTTNNVRVHIVGEDDR